MTTIAFLGDSVTEGHTTANPIPPTIPYPGPCATRLGWSGVNLGRGGTGYVATWGGYSAFRGRISDVVAAVPNVVIVEGGADDVPQSGISLASLMAELPLFFSALVAAVPAAQIYVLTPWPCKGYRIPSEIAAATAAIVAAASVRGIPIIDWQPWSTGTGYEGHPIGDGNADVYYSTDNIHPGNVGMAYLGTRLAFAIKPPSTGLDY